MKISANRKHFDPGLVWRALFVGECSCFVASTHTGTETETETDTRAESWLPLCFVHLHMSSARSRGYNAVVAQGKPAKVDRGGSSDGDGVVFEEEQRRSVQQSTRQWAQAPHASRRDPFEHDQIISSDEEIETPSSSTAKPTTSSTPWIDPTPSRKLQQQPQQGIVLICKYGAHRQAGRERSREVEREREVERDGERRRERRRETERHPPTHTNTHTHTHTHPRARVFPVADKSGRQLKMHNFVM